MTEYVSFDSPVLNKREIMRYARSQNAEEIEALLDECIEKCGGVLNFAPKYTRKCKLKFA